jgi:hypothetical protein
MKYVLPLIVCSLLLSWKPTVKKSLSPKLEAGKLSVDLPGMKLNNAFPEGEEQFGLYKQIYTTVWCEVMKVKFVKDVTYYDAWNNEPLQTRVSDD